MAADPLRDAQRLLAARQAEYERLGYPRRLVEVGLLRAWRTAEEKARPISPAIHDQAFLDLLSAELEGVRTWLSGQASYLGLPVA